MTNYLTSLSEHLEVDQLLASFTCLHGHDVDTSFKLRDCEICGSREFFELRPAVDIGQGQLAAIPYSACCKCGHVMQNPTFAPSFFSEFYKLQYHHQRKISARNIEYNAIDDDLSQGRSAHDNAFQRGTHLYSYLQRHSLLPDLKSPTYLDVGCGSGGFLTMFASKGFICYGNDPDPYAFNHINTMTHNHDLRECAGEDMDYKESFDIITIIGSLEHCQDPLLILRKIHSYLKPSGLLIVEGRFSPVSASTSYLNFNHQRIFRSKQFQAALRLTGFNPFISTTFPVCGENLGRDGGGWVFSYKGTAPKPDSISSFIHEEDLFERPEDLKLFLDQHDHSLTS